MDVHLPCPPLHEWLPARFAEGRVGAWSSARTPRRLRATLAEWPRLDADEPAALAELDALDVLIFGLRLERPELPESLLARLRPGALVVELALPRPRALRRLLGLEPPPAARAARAQARTLDWLGRGHHGVEQWECVEPARVLVTLSRRG
ncbi:hypothetical protein G6O69_16120 [Pseudenhygromyxa sp. WMMC2535]|uniref:hypothetical protein n=1 Tax=Pseudenhygromyxa sp. WMMC2535 TaxID=2712867 RepID=UPI001553B57A|nr:hypothetical protein [Pseudenhygromyxa sp. WMMC2535]NVB39369.1 hypothetical protein [Pseudenhygromyxa sp. WMMC2535]